VDISGKIPGGGGGSLWQTHEAPPAISTI
jgi:hypothetical protein